MKRIIRTLLLVLCIALLLEPAQATSEAGGQARVDALLNAKVDVISIKGFRR